MLVNTARGWGNVVRDRRLELGMTQEDLAKRIGRTRWWVLRFEAGHAGSGSIENLLKMLDVLELYIDVKTEPGYDDSDPMLADPSGPDPWGGRS